MRVVVQRVTSAKVRIAGREEAAITNGLVLFAAIAESDTAETVSKMAEKIGKLRIFADEQGKMNNSISENRGAVLVVSQFTLYAAVKGQNRPFFGESARPEVAEPLLQSFIAFLRAAGITVASGKFGAYMQVSLVNDGPVTIVLDSKTL